MGRAVVRQNDFAFGELSPDHAAAGDRDAVSKSLKKGRNIRLLNSYNFMERFGSRKVKLFVNGEHVLAPGLMDETGTEYLGALIQDRINFHATDGTLLQTVNGLPFASLDEVKEAVMLSRVNELYIAHQKYPTQVLTRDKDTGNWSLSEFAFAEGPGGTLLQPYYRYAPKGITLQPSALTGTVNVTFSDDVLDADHVGVIFRYGVVDGAGKELQIATVVDAQHGTATVLNDLPPTMKVTVGDASGFVLGEEVKGLDTQATGFITNISGSDISILMARGFEGFDDETVDTDHDGTPDSGEYLVGQFTRSRITISTQTTASPAASVAWDEAAISPVHGYPGCVFERTGRLGFTNFPDLPCGIVLSSPDTTNNFDVGSGTAADAMFEILNEGDQRILRAVPAANLVLLTTRAAYYVPQGTDVPLSHQTFAAIKIGPVGIADNSNPAVIDEGVVYVARGANRIMALLSTGSLTAPWKLVDVSSRSSHLITSPTSIAVCPGSTQAPERYVMVLNSDGTVAVLFFDEAPTRLGWVRWDTPNGLHTSMVSVDGVLYTNCNRTLLSGAASFLEKFDSTTQLDCAIAFTEPGSVALLDLAGETVAVNQGTAYLGTYTVLGDGSISGLAAGDYEAGYHFDATIALWTPEPEGDPRPNFSRRHISRVSVQTLDSQSFQFGIADLDDEFRATVPVYKDDEDDDDPPPLRTTWERESFFGWLTEPNVRIWRHIPQPLQILSVAQEVPF